MEGTSKGPSFDPERVACDRELARVLEGAIDRLPDIYRGLLCSVTSTDAASLRPRKTSASPRFCQNSPL